MNAIRHLGSGLIYAVVSVVLVVGGLSLALAEGSGNTPPPTVKPSPTLYVASATPTEVTPTFPAAVPPSSSTPQPVIVTATSQSLVVVPATATLRPLATSTRIIYPTAVPCGPYYGWIKAYTVQSGDTLFHIATLYRTTVGALQVANCKRDTFIFPGELLWVPNVPTITPGVTIIPTFETSTPFPTLPLTATILPNFTATATSAPIAVPSDTAIP